MMTSNLRQLSGDFFKQHEINSNSKSLLCDSLSTSKLFTTILTFFNTILLNGSAIIFIIFMFTGKKILLLPVFIPFVNHEALLGYLLNLGLQMSMGFIGFFTFTSYDTTIILYGMHSILMARMFEIKMKDLEGTLKNEENKLQYRQKFIETVKYYEDYKSFMREFENLVKIPFLVAICVNFVGLVCCIMELINESMELGIAGSAGLFVGFLLPFLTVIMISYQVRKINHRRIYFFNFYRLQDTIITRSISQFPWNDIPPAYQNLHLHFLISTQHHFGINLSFLGFLRFPLVTTIFLTLHHIVAYFLVFALFPHHNRVALG